MFISYCTLVNSGFSGAMPFSITPPPPYVIVSYIQIIPSSLILVNIGLSNKGYCEEDRVILMNSALYAMKMLQKEMEGEAEKAGIRN